MTVNIAGTFKKDDRESNGLENIAEDLEKHPLSRRVVVGLIETKRTTIDHADGGSRIVVVRFVALEPVDGDDSEVVQAILDARHNARTGRAVPSSLFDAPTGDDVCGPVYADPLDNTPVGVCTAPRGHDTGDQPTPHVYQPEWDPSDNDDKDA